MYIYYIPNNNVVLNKDWIELCFPAAMQTHLHVVTLDIHVQNIDFIDSDMSIFWEALFRVIKVKGRSLTD